MDSPEKFIKAVQEGVATVEFRKINTDELRIMPCTLNSEVAGTPSAIKSFDPLSDNIAVWCLDKAAWRSFRVSTVEKWYEGYPEGYEL